MGVITREGTAPIADGELASGTEVELELAKIFNVINGNIDDANVKSAAGIDGSKLGNATIATAKLANLAVTTAKLANASVTLGKMDTENVVRAYVETDTGTETFSTSTSWVNVDGMAGVTVAAGAATDYVFCDFTFTAHGTNAFGITTAWTFEIDGTDKSPLASTTFDIDGSTGMAQGHIHVCWAQVVPGAAAFTVVPRYREDHDYGTGAVDFGEDNTAGTPITKILRVQRIPHN